MTFAKPCVLTINGGSSNIWFALYGVGRAPLRALNIGSILDRKP